jgi:hypothetical protein
MQLTQDLGFETDQLPGIWVVGLCALDKSQGARKIMLPVTHVCEIKNGNPSAGIFLPGFIRHLLR